MSHMNRPFTLADSIGRENVGQLFDTVSRWDKQRKQNQKKAIANGSVAGGRKATQSHIPR